METDEQKNEFTDETANDVEQSSAKTGKKRGRSRKSKSPEPVNDDSTFDADLPPPPPPPPPPEDFESTTDSPYYGESAAPARQQTFDPTDRSWLSHLEKAPELPKVSGRDRSWDSPDALTNDSPFRESTYIHNYEKPISVYRRTERQLPWGAIATVTPIVLLLLVFAAGVAFKVGERRGRSFSERQQTIAKLTNPLLTVLPAEADEELTAALRAINHNRDTREPDREAVRKAAANIAALAEKFPHVASLKVLAALANLQATNLDEAEKWAKKAIEANDRASDAYGVLAIIETLKPRTFGDSTLQARTYLQQAIAADVSNPTPRVELASRLRSAGQSDEAEQMYIAALVRLHPVDSRTIIQPILRFIAIDRKADYELQKTEPATDNPEELLVAAYTALRFEDFALAERLLQRAQTLLPLNTFRYIVQDRGFMKYSYRPEIKKFTTTQESDQ